VTHYPVDLPGEVAFVNGASLIDLACNADYRTAAIAAHHHGDRTIAALTGRSFLRCRVVRRPIKTKKPHGGDTTYRHRQEAL
jgi:hypothetical protein